MIRRLLAHPLHQVRRRLRNQQGFVLLETIFTVFLLAMCSLLTAGLASAVQAQERHTDLVLALSRTAQSALEEYRSQDLVSTGTSTRTMVVHNIPVIETRELAPDGNLVRITLHYTWQEGGRHHEQVWATLHR